MKLMLHGCVFTRHDLGIGDDMRVQLFQRDRVRRSKQHT